MLRLSKIGMACGLALLAAGLSSAQGALNLVANGSFSTNGGVGQLAGGITSLGSWTVGPAIVTSNTPAGTAQFDFVMDGTAASSGFPTVFSPPNTYLWGPGTPASQGGASANGFGASPDGGAFVGVSSGYATALVSQTVTGLTVGNQYTLSFQYAASQFSQYNGATSQDWQVTLGVSTYTTPVLSIASHGFSGWQTFSTTITATSASETLSFLAQAPTGGNVLPINLLDGVSLLPAAIPEPASLAAIGIPAILGLLRRRRTPACCMAN